MDRFRQLAVRRAPPEIIEPTGTSVLQSLVPVAIPVTHRSRLSQKRQVNNAEQLIEVDRRLGELSHHSTVNHDRGPIVIEEKHRGEDVPVLKPNVESHLQIDEREGELQEGEMKDRRDDHPALIHSGDGIQGDGMPNVHTYADVWASMPSHHINAIGINVVQDSPVGYDTGINAYLNLPIIDRILGKHEGRHITQQRDNADQIHRHPAPTAPPDIASTFQFPSFRLPYFAALPSLSLPNSVMTPLPVGLDQSIDLTVILGYHGVIFLVALWFFSKHLYRDYEIKSGVIQILFALTCSASISMLHLLLFDLLQWIDPTVRLLGWQVDLVVVLGLVYVVLPCSSRSTLAFGCLTFTPFLWFLFSYCGTFIDIPAYTYSTDHLLARVGVCGVTVVSSLAGYAAINFPYQNVSFFLSPITQRQVREVECDLLFTLGRIADTKIQIKYAEHQAALDASRPIVSTPLSQSRASVSAYHPGTHTGTTGGSRWSPSFDPGTMELTLRETHQGRVESHYDEVMMSQWATMGCLGQVDRSIDELHLDVNTLERSAMDLYSTLSTLIDARGNCLRASTMIGKLNNLLGWIMTGVCVYRLIMSFVNVVLRRVSYVDPATRLLTLIFTIMKIRVDAAFWAPYISLFLVGCIIVVNIRGFLDRLLIIFRSISSSVSSDMIAVVMSEIMALYFCACALLTRIYLPTTYRLSMTQALGPTLNFPAFHLVFDLVFLISSAASLLYIVFASSVRTSKFKEF
eukprot:GHVN01079575.1.p1 GENE.GHVN01079575.1~~GHVN01079575.1.p1  ORF type:complete len:743 (+),score=111.77 GHVN01079575.1:129-2357(+)